MRDPVRSVYQCEATHGGYSRCTQAEGHVGPHSNASYTWTEQPTVEQKAKFVEVLSGRVTKVVGSEDPKKLEPFGSSSDRD